MCNVLLSGVCFFVKQRIAGFSIEPAADETEAIPVFYMVFVSIRIIEAEINRFLAGAAIANLAIIRFFKLVPIFWTLEIVFAFAALNLPNRPKCNIDCV